MYIKENIYKKRREDLEIRDIESIWLAVPNHKRMLFGLFYRPPNASANYFSDIEDFFALASIALTVDTSVPDIVITGDFNLNFLNIN